jgi:hypothetical protein
MGSVALLRAERASRGTGSWNARRPNHECIDAAVGAYRRHDEPIDEELDRLEAVMYVGTSPASDTGGPDQGQRCVDDHRFETAAWASTSSHLGGVAAQRRPGGVTALSMR